MAFHNDEKKYRRMLSKIEENFPESYTVIQDFADDLIAQGISVSRVYSYLLWLHNALKVLEKPIEDWDRLDVRKAINEYQFKVSENKISEHSVRELKKSLRRFFRWLGKDELVNWYTLGEIEPKVSPQDLITPEEFDKMMCACKNSRDRALISLLYETGARIGELGSMKIKDVTFDDYGGTIWLPKSKTKRRKLRIVYSATFLASWISDHPIGDKPDAPLWVKLSGKKRLQAMSYADIRAQLSKIAKRAEIKKRVYPHLFRHTRATRLLAKVPESIGAKYMGWVPGSKMVKIYVHLSSEDVDEAILKLHGIKTNGNGNDLEVKQCPRCTMINPASSRFCSRCGLPLTEEAVVELEEWEKRKGEAMKELTNPDFIRLLVSIHSEMEKLKEEVERLRKLG